MATYPPNVTNAALILVSCGSQAEARSIAWGLVEKRLAAGVQMLPISSVYTWKDEIVEDDEWLLVIKTSAQRYREVEAAVLAEHSYEVPQVIMVPLTEGHGPYLDWIGENTG